MDELKDKLCYLASPYTKRPYEDAHAQACVIAGRLMQAGYLIFSPIAHFHYIGAYVLLNPFDLDFWMRQCGPFINKCDALIVAKLPGWAASEGMMIETGCFEVARKPIYDLDPATMELTKRDPQKPPRDRIDGWSEEQIKSDHDGYLSERGGASA